MSTFAIEEVGTDTYPSPEAANRAAIPEIAQTIVHIIRAGLESGRFVVIDGVVKLAESPTISSTPSTGGNDALPTPPR